MKATLVVSTLVLIAVPALASAATAPPARVLHRARARRRDRLAGHGRHRCGARRSRRRGGAGQPLVVLRADVERANLEMVETRAKLEADVAAAVANLQLAKQKLARAEKLYEATFISKQAPRPGGGGARSRRAEARAGEGAESRDVGRRARRRAGAGRRAHDPQSLLRRRGRPLHESRASASRTSRCSRSQ